MKFVKAIANLFANTGAKEPAKKKPWQEGKPWCTPYNNKGTVLWDMDKMHRNYERRLHGELKRENGYTPYA